MGVYSRFKRDPDGFRKLVELLESTPKSRRNKMIEVGMEEDPSYTEKALELTFSFEDVLGLPADELREVIALALPRIVGVAISPFDDDLKRTFYEACDSKAYPHVRDAAESEFSKSEIGGAQFKLIAACREAEKRGKIKTKRIEA